MATATVPLTSNDVAACCPPLTGGVLAAMVFLYQNERPLPAVDTAAPAGPKEALAPSL